ncbi:hypothetical protein [Fusobacterium gastrosuis]|uniref:hypothetical protein n=1 Tax=Fusobacterium gastrosuis TaxID=1755100 RepID=UPI002972EC75|nr:hypothetical protein [Fusobacteriaceae bacterium]MDY5714080.1 hypothetical protein [Fusobacterium gastrosuis]
MEKEKVLEIEFMQVWDKWAWKFVKNNTKDIIYSSVDKTNTLTIVNGVLFTVINDNKTNINEFDMLNDYSKTKLEEFVNEINERYGIPKRWRAIEYSEYYFLGSHMNILSNYEHYDIIDNERYELGNYFKTKEEAKKVANSKEWKEFWAKVRAGKIGGDE